MKYLVTLMLVLGVNAQAAGFFGGFFEDAASKLKKDAVEVEGDAAHVAADVSQGKSAEQVGNDLMKSGSDATKLLCANEYRTGKEFGKDAIKTFKHGNADQLKEDGEDYVVEEEECLTKEI